MKFYFFFPFFTYYSPKNQSQNICKSIEIKNCTVNKFVQCIDLQKNFSRLKAIPVNSKSISHEHCSTIFNTQQIHWHIHYVIRKNILTIESIDSMKNASNCT